MNSDKSEQQDQRTRDDCPECGGSGSVSFHPWLDDTFECSRCMIAFRGDGEVVARE